MLGVPTWQTGILGLMNPRKKATFQPRAGFPGQLHPALPTFKATEEERKSERNESRGVGTDGFPDSKAFSIKIRRSEELKQLSG